MRKTTLLIQAAAYRDARPVETTLGQISALGAALSAIAADMRETYLVVEKVPATAYRRENVWQAAPMVETGYMAATVSIRVGDFEFTIRVEEPIPKSALARQEAT